MLRIVWLFFISAIALLAIVTGRKTSLVTHSLIPGKEPVTFAVYAWIAATFFAYLYHEEWFYGVDFDVILAMILTVAVAYPLGYHFAPVRTQGIAEYDFVTKMLIDAYYIVPYRNRKGDMCIMEQRIWPKFKAFLGIHAHLIFPFGKATNTYNVRTASKFLKTTTKSCVSVIDKSIETIVVKKGPFKIKTKIYSYYVSDVHDLDPREFMIRAEIFRDAMKMVAKLQHDLQVERSKKAEIYQVAAQLVADISDAGVDDEAIREARNRLRKECDRSTYELKKAYGDIYSQERLTEEPPEGTEEDAPNE